MIGPVIINHARRCRSCEVYRLDDLSRLRLAREELEPVALVNFSSPGSLLRQSLVLGRIFHQQAQEL